ncbi:nuclear transport factor 2 family protein [Actinomadura sp. KC06]|uniref:nuclear transport factor 2 family protein n=1 Tax=Actinomadura sp. KC06 TaxID=2530369 RepID=UPI0014055C6A|nr:nuclear transport factor 2 family protein [Actinomadura sp. KC06]
MESIEATVRRLAAESGAGQVILRYARGLDRRDFDMVWDCFHPDAHVEGTSFGGPLRSYLPRLLDGVRSYPRTMHFMGNQLREVDGDDLVRTETYCIAHHFADAEGRREALVMGVRYLDELRLDGGRWRITDRRVHADWSRGAAGPTQPDDR